MGAFSFNMILSVLIKMLRSSIQTEYFFILHLSFPQLSLHFAPLKHLSLKFNILYWKYKIFSVSQKIHTKTDEMEEYVKS